MNIPFFHPLAVAVIFVAAIAHGAISLNESSSPMEQEAAADALAQKTLTNLNQGEGPAAPANLAYSEGRFDEAVKLAQPLADQGDADALFLLGLAHETGKGLPASRDKALEFYRKASGAGHKDAAYRSSLIMLASEKEEERSEARKVLEQAAQSDPAVAGRILGEAWLRGQLSKEPDANKAAEWWQRAVAADDLPSIHVLAALHEGQFGFPEMKDQAKANELYNKAAKLGDVSALVTLGSRLLMGEQSQRDEKRGRALLERAVEKENFTACLVLGDYEENIKKDDKAALAAYERGKDGGQIDCMLRAAEFYIQGKGGKKDESRGKALLLKAAESGHPQAQLRVAMAILATENPDVGSAYLNLLSAANQNLATAQNELGLLYLSGGLGVADHAAAVAWLTRAAKLGDASARNNLGTLYEAGAAGLNQDYKNAVELYSLAAQQGHVEATLALARLFSEGPIEKDLPRAWAMASIAVERGNESASELRDKIAAQLDKKQLAEAEELLENLKEPTK